MQLENLNKGPNSTLPPFLRAPFRTIYDLASAWNIAYWTVRREVIKDHKLHQDYPCICNPIRGHRLKRIYRIPDHVAERIYRKLCKGGHYAR